jgi:ABC-type glycerol-3-phosphate transport system substrate-binding protein
VKRKRSILFVLLVVALLSFSMLPSGVQGQESINIVFLTFESPVLTASFWDTGIDAALETLPDNITVERIVSPGIDRTTYAKELLASDQFPDVLQSINTQEFVDAELLQAWDSAWVEEHFIIPYGNALNGQVWQAPTNAQVIPYVFYNKAIFEEVGVVPPTTWAELLDVSQKLEDAGYKVFQTCGAADAWCTSIMPSGIISAEVLGTTPDWVAQRKEGGVAFADEAMVTAFEHYQDLVEEGWVDTGDLGVDYASANRSFIDGEAAMYPMGSWFLQQAANEAEFEVGVFLMPREDGAQIVPFNVGGGTHVSAISENPEEAMLFAQAFALEPSTLAALIENDSAFPLLKGMTIEDYGVTVSDLFLEGYSYVEKEGTSQVDAFAWVNNDSALLAGVTDELYVAIQNIILGEDVQTEMENIDTFWDRAAER